MDEEKLMFEAKTPPRAFVYAGGQVLASNVIEVPRKGDLAIAADSGYLNAALLGVKPDILVGDLDSLPPDTDLPSDIERITLPCEKDCTDTQAAVEVALEHGYNDIIIIGGVGTRLDHSLSTVAVLEYLKSRGARGYVTNGYNRIRYLENDSLLISRSDYKYFSVLALDKVCKGVGIEGGKYPLKNARLFRGNGFAVSNEIEGNVALISVKKGAVLVIESRD